MNTRFAGRKLVVALFVCFAVILLCASMAQAQSAGTGAISGTVTDPQGRAVPNATVTVTNVGTNQERTSTTGSDGQYKFPLLSPGTYRLKIGAAGFKTSEVSGITVNVTETATEDKVLEVGAVTQTVTVESSVETLQTESSTLGTTVTGANIAALPMANGNYTEILSLTAGTTASVDNATALGKGTQDISANGVDPGSNNFQMDGVAVNNIANSGSSNDGTIYTGIPVPSPDAIGEFKIQTSTYDASYGRNPGANVNVTHEVRHQRVSRVRLRVFPQFGPQRERLLLQQDARAHPHQVFDQNQFGGYNRWPDQEGQVLHLLQLPRNSLEERRGASRERLRRIPVVTSFLQSRTGNFFDVAIPRDLRRGTCPSPASLGVAPNTPDFSSIGENCERPGKSIRDRYGHQRSEYRWASECSN